MSQRFSVWSVTINNPTPADEEDIALARQKGWTVDGQLEKGENGTPHYQLIVRSGQQRFGTIKKAFPRAHIEGARNVEALAQYVKKEETRVGELPQSNELYPSLQKLWDLMAEFIQEFNLEQRWYDAAPEGKLELFDEFIRHTIEQGYVVETMAANPQTRSCVKLYGENIYIRSLRRRTDRQTDTSWMEFEGDEIISQDIQNASEGKVQSESETSSLCEEA